MSIRFDTAGDDIARTTNLPSITSFTMMGWARVSVDTNDFACFLNFGQNGASPPYYYLGTNSDGTTFAIYNGTTVVTGSALTVGIWNHVAMTVAGTGAGQFLGYLNGALNITHAGNSSVTAQELTVGASPDGNQLNGCIAAVKIYGAVLTAAEIQNEMWYYTPQRRDNLSAWLPCIHPTAASNGEDLSGTGNFTVNGTLAVEDGPPIAWGPRARRYFIPTAAVATGTLGYVVQRTYRPRPFAPGHAR